MFRKLLIANRGEIACRIIRTARRMGIATVAVYSDADANALHVALADEAWCIGPAAPRESYLRIDGLIDVARRCGAQAVHPGYGFLAENADFAEACAAAGLAFVGPPASAIRAMGGKSQAKALMQQAGVPLVPGYHGAAQDLPTLQAAAAEIGYPVLIKASAGGGGKGMRIVESDAVFPAGLAAAQREARSSFGDDRVLVERYLTRPRHIEIQVFADSHGNTVHLFERDCSIQRRHQKIIEEAPAPGMRPEMRAAMGQAAIAAAQAVGYVGAGTVEFIVEGDSFAFMEMNTRLQVEHPETEAVTGIDLVEWQLRVASGEPLPLTQDQITLTGQAVEARLYAEDPATGFLPSVGRLDHLRLPQFGRVDSGVIEGGSVSPFYDPMLAKLIHHAPTRTAALAGLAAMAGAVECWPVRTNAAFLIRALADADVIAGRLDTGLVGRRGDDWAARPVPGDALMQAVAQAINGPAPTQAGWRLNAPPAPVIVRIDDGAAVHTVTLNGGDAAGSITPTPRGVIASEAGTTWLMTAWRPAGAEADAGAGSLHAPMPGLVTAVMVASGDAVTRGQTLLTMEAMKMEQAIKSPIDGVVAQLPVVVGQQVGADALLIRIEQEQA